jgi:hypothetical protein
MIWFFLTIAILLIVFGWIIYKNSKDDPQGQDVGQLMGMFGLSIVSIIIMSFI